MEKFVYVNIIIYFELLIFKFICNITAEELAPPPGPVTCSDTDNPNRDYDTCECINAKYGPICDRG